MKLHEFPLALFVCSSLALGACGDSGGDEAGDEAGTDTGTDTNDTTTTTTAEAGTDDTTTTTADTGTDTTTSGTGTGADADTTTSDTGGAECGNGEIEEGEECDDGADNGPEFACLADCTLNVCGDGNVGPDEGCDDGNTEAGDGCSEVCLLEDLDPEVILCGNKVYECGDTIDNDMDGLVDLADPECISPCDDDESSFETDLPGQNNDCKQDCYFDTNSGGGDDNCEWNLQCDPMNPGANVGCPYDPDFNMCDVEMPPQCLEFCSPNVPNGCDCFGCCEVNGMLVYLDSGEGCSIDAPENCEPCTFFENCNNPCNPQDCELCFGQDIEDLPEECDGMPSCPEGQTSCQTEADCLDGEFCQTGCCIPIIPQ